MVISSDKTTMSIKRNALWNLAGAGIPLIAALFCIPYLLRVLGAEGFGVITLVWALIGYFSLFDFGIGRALTYELGKRASASLTELAPYVRAGIVLTSATGVIGAIIVALIAKPLSASWLNIGLSWQSDAFAAFLIAAVGIIPTTIASGLRGALEGINRFSASNINRIVLGSLMFALPAWSIFYHGSTLWIATLYMVIARSVIMLAVLYQLRWFMVSNVKLEHTHLASLLNYGVWITVTGIIGPLMIFGDRFFVSAAVGTELLPQYAIPQEGLQRLLLIPAAICGALLPQLASLLRDQIASAYYKNFKRVAWLMLIICSAVALISYPALSIWISEEFAKKASIITLILTIGIWFNGMSMVPYTVIHAMGYPKITAIFHLVELLFYAILLWLLTKKLGLLGAAIAWTSRVILDYILLRITVKRILNG
jgi:O-antigen/teichoic acid export membrane protein